MLRRNKILCAKSGWNAHHGHHAYKCSKILSRTGGLIFTKTWTWYEVFGTTALHSLFKCWPFTARSVLETKACTSKEKVNDLVTCICC